MPDNMEGAENTEGAAYAGCADNAEYAAHAGRLRQAVDKAVQPRFIHATFPLINTAEGIQVGDTPLILTGRDAGQTLAHAREGVFMAATLGMDVDRLIAYTQKINIADAVIMDKLASEAMEALFDRIQAELSRGYPLTPPLFCGCGDLPLAIQPTLLSLLNAQKTVGIYCGQDHLMLPRKSVTALWGISDQPMARDRCEACPLKQDCTPGRVGNRCGRKRIY